MRDRERARERRVRVREEETERERRLEVGGVSWSEGRDEAGGDIYIHKSRCPPPNNTEGKQDNSHARNRD